MRYCRWAGVVLAALLQANAATGADWPSRPILIVVPYAAGGSTDLLARILGDRLAARLGKPVEIENIGGANGNLGAASVAHGAADGYRFLFTPPGPLAINASLYSGLPFDPDELEPVVNVATIPNVLEVNPGLPAHSVAELIALLRREPGRLNYGTGGVGSTPHLTVALFLHEVGAEAQHVPYKGSGPMLQDLVAGSIQFTIDNLPSSLAFIRAGKLRALAVSSATRADALPDIPTIAEAAIPGFEAVSWFCLVAPKGTAGPIVEHLNRAVNEALEDAQVRERLAAVGATPAGGTPADLGRLIAVEREKWKQVIERSGARLE